MTIVESMLRAIDILRSENMVLKKGTLRDRIESAITSTSAENGSNTPDFILAEYLADCLAAFDKSSRAREKWYNGSGTTSEPTRTQP